MQAYHLTGDVIHRQERASTWVLPSDLGHSLRTRYGAIDDIGPAVRGLRQWLRINLLAPADAAIPSEAVAVLWQELLTWAGWDDYCVQLYGPEQTSWPSELALMPDDASLALAYALACRDEGHTYAMELPELFTADERIGIVDGRRWTLDCRERVVATLGNGKRLALRPEHHECQADPDISCVHHRLLPLIPEDLTDRARVGTPSRRHPPDGAKGAPGPYTTSGAILFGTPG